MASGLIAGESLTGVLFAGLVLLVRRLHVGHQDRSSASDRFAWVAGPAGAWTSLLALAAIAWLLVELPLRRQRRQAAPTRMERSIHDRITRRSWPSCTGFTRTFWVANILELFERFAYYGSKAILAVYVAEQVGLGPEKAGLLVGSVFNTLLYFLPPLAGTVVDRYGFKKSLLACFSIFCVGYFLIGLGGPARGQAAGARRWAPRRYMILALVITAIGGSLIKPSHRRHRRAHDRRPRPRSLGYSIYYTLVNLGGAHRADPGPAGAREPGHRLRAGDVVARPACCWSSARCCSSASRRGRPTPPPPSRWAACCATCCMVFGNLQFITFLVIFSGFWVDVLADLLLAAVLRPRRPALREASSSSRRWTPGPSSWSPCRRRRWPRSCRRSPP